MDLNLAALPLSYLPLSFSWFCFRLELMLHMHFAARAKVTRASKAFDHKTMRMIKRGKSDEQDQIVDYAGGSDHSGGSDANLEDESGHLRYEPLVRIHSSGRSS